MAAADVTAVMAAFAVAVRHTVHLSPGIRGVLSLLVTVEHIVLLAGFAAIIPLVFRAASLYDAGRVRRWRDELVRVLVGTTALAAIVCLFIATSRSTALDRSALIYFWAAGSAAAVATRTARAVFTRSRRCRVLIVGSGPRALRICRELSADPLTSYQVIGFVDTYSATHSAFMARRTLGPLDQLESILVHEHVDEVHVGLPVRSQYAEIEETVRVCERVGVKAMYGADLFELPLARSRVLAPTPRIALQVVTEDGLPIAFKRAIDIAGAVAALALFGPLMLATAGAVAATSGRPVLYAQERYGLNRRRFRMFKFRTMVTNAEQLQAALEARNEAEGPVFKIARDPRVTPLGRFLRRTSIDELPQLFNVLRGDMSLVGPRPLPLRDVARFTRPPTCGASACAPASPACGRSAGAAASASTNGSRSICATSTGGRSRSTSASSCAPFPRVLRGTGAQLSGASTERDDHDPNLTPQNRGHRRRWLHRPSPRHAPEAPGRLGARRRPEDIRSTRRPTPTSSWCSTCAGGRPASRRRAASTRSTRSPPTWAGWASSRNHHAEILHNNMLISTHTLEAARQNGVKRYLYTSSACVYPEYRQTDATSSR